MKRVSLTAGTLFVALGALACTSDTPAEPRLPDMSPVARAYLTEVVAVMQAHSVNRQDIDWRAFRIRVLEAARGARTIRETHPAIRVALEQLGDNHSFYVTSQGTSGISAATGCPFAPTPLLPALPATIGYVSIRGFSGAGVQAFADSILGAIRRMDRADLVGWIVDLRGNSGGNMWPMIAGVGPVLGEGTAGHFIAPNGAPIPWGYARGTALLNSQQLARVTAPYQLRRTAPRVAVLTDERVASSGEAVAIAFRARPNTRSFGTPTCGKSTGNQAFSLSDGARLVLTTTIIADRRAVPYGGQVIPDEVIPDPVAAVQRAVAWLHDR